MTRRLPPTRQAARTIVLGDREYRIGQPLGSTPAQATCRLSLRLPDALPVALGNAHSDVAEAVLRAFDQAPGLSIKELMAAADLHVVFDQWNEANGRCRIFAKKNKRGQRMSGEITVADTFVGYLAPRRRALVHFDAEDEHSFPAWLKSSWRDRAVAAAIAAL